MTDLPRIRSVIPWWYVGGAVLALAISLALIDVLDGGPGALMWGPLIGVEIRARRFRLAADPSALATRGREGPRWVEPMLAAAWLPISLGLSVLLHQIPFFRDEPVDPGNVLLGAFLVVPPVVAVAALILLLSARARRRRSRAAAQRTT